MACQTVVCPQLRFFPCLKRLYHSFICIIPMASSQKACWIFLIVCTCSSKLLAELNTEALFNAFWHDRNWCALKFSTCMHIKGVINSYKKKSLNGKLFFLLWTCQILFEWTLYIIYFRKRIRGLDKIILNIASYLYVQNVINIAQFFFLIWIY